MELSAHQASSKSQQCGNPLSQGCTRHSHHASKFCDLGGGHRARQYFLLGRRADAITNLGLRVNLVELDSRLPQAICFRCSAAIFAIRYTRAWENCLQRNCSVILFTSRETDLRLTQQRLRRCVSLGETDLRLTGQRLGRCVSLGGREVYK